jgi:flagellar basal-body rod protein FlgC
VDLGGGRTGVEVAKVRRDMSDFKVVQEPTNTEFCDKDGNVYYPNVDIGVEMVDAMEASRAYEANVTAIETTKSMMNSTLRIMA